MKYKIHLMSDWHCGSGLSAGAESDAEVLKDENNHPYIPGKTIKGLLKDALFEMPEKASGIQKILIQKIFGEEIWNEKKDKVTGTKAGTAFFSNATLGKDEQKEISKELAEFLYHHISSTAIDKNGIADTSSLRTMEVCMPLVLEGEIELENEQEDKVVIEKATKWVRHLGVNRNRGLGRCKIVIES